MLGSIDRHCPNAWRGQFTRDDHRHPTIIPEVASSQDMWIWHAFFDVPCSQNDLNVIHQSEIFNDVIQGTGPDTRFTVLGMEYRRGYYLADRIYLLYSTIIKTILHPSDKKRKKLAKFQEAARKEIKQCLGVLQQKWHIIECPSRAFTPKKLRCCMDACILIHNMIIEDEGRMICVYDENAVNENYVPMIYCEEKEKCHVALQLK
ncbi:uncharacterized protein LOC110876935 [Helianthus annuus]|uniref:uncharacterized protein LOC110876935 n=1 Tax=Helianthus annuus TaxID=4232 RepID=UPI000B8F6C79|nr:uncharacterized protein LOC110876935 [Helianthus annuus]